jgi:hypothetical protein
VTFSEQVTEINNSAFAGNKQLSDIIIPETISKLGDNAFYNCSKLKNIEIKALTPPIISDSTFLTNSGITNISVPTSVINTYKVAPV